MLITRYFIVFLLLCLVPITNGYVEETAVDKQLKEHILFHSEGPNNVGWITIGGKSNAISQATWLYVRNALDFYKKNPPIFIVLELNTPGGEVFSAEQISDALKEMDTQYHIPIVAYIDNWAMSAGAMLAYSCRFIAIVKDASMGAAEPVLASQEGKMEAASEKINSALRADFANRAIFFGRNPYIAEAMVDKDVILVMRKGKIIKLNNESQIKTEEPDADLVISPKGKLLTLNAEQLIEFGVADLLVLPESLVPVTAEEEAMGRWPASKTLLFQSPFFKNIPNSFIMAYSADWKTRFFMILANPIVSSILFLGLLIGFYVEISSPGFGVAGTVGVLSLFFIILSSFAQETAGWLELIFMGVGLLVLVVDFTLLPTFGLLGTVGVLFFLAGLFGLMLPGIESASFDFDTKTFNAAGEFVLNRLVWLCITLLIGAIIIALLTRYLMPRFSAFKRFVLSGNEQDAARGFVAGENPRDLPSVGAKGIVMGMLRPSGKVMINDQIYDAISNGSFIGEKTAVVVVGLEGSTIVVEPQS